MGQKQQRPESPTEVERADTIGSASSPGDLRGITGSTTLHTVVVGGFWAIGDGGGGVFHWDPNSSSSDDGGTVINPTNHTGNGRWIRAYSGGLDVKWFGAKLVNPQDDAPFIQNAINVAFERWLCRWGRGK